MIAQWKGELVKVVIDKIEKSIQSVDTDQTISSRFVTYKVTCSLLHFLTEEYIPRLATSTVKKSDGKIACVSNEVKRLENNHHCLLCFLKGQLEFFELLPSATFIVFSDLLEDCEMTMG